MAPSMVNTRMLSAGGPSWAFAAPPSNRSRLNRPSSVRIVAFTAPPAGDEGSESPYARACGSASSRGPASDHPAEQALQIEAFRIAGCHRMVARLAQALQELHFAARVER